MALWVVRAGRHGEQQETALSKGLVCHAWNDLPDYSGYTKEQLKALYEKTYPEQNERQVISGMSQVWRFAHGIRKGDLVALPLKTESAVEFGRVTGDYQYEKVAANVMHIRKVEWMKRVLRSALPSDILASINIPSTVFRVERNDAENRVKTLLGIQDVGPVAPPSEEETDESEDVNVDVEQAARDDILKFIQDRFKGHDLARLVNAVLRAQGYKTSMSPPGPDGGVDILAGLGLLGFDKPRLCVQVKSGNSPEGQKTFNELCGVVSKFGAEQGLLVSWSGFTNSVKKDAKKDFFKIRLWDQGDVLDAILESYEKLDDQIKGELPLRKIWMLVADE